MTSARIRHVLQLPPLFLKALFTNTDDVSEKQLAKNRHLRAELHRHAILSKNWADCDLQARREYWYKQMYFLVCLIKKMYGETTITMTELNDCLKRFILNTNELDILIVNILDHEYSSFQESPLPKEKTWEEKGDELIMRFLPKNDPCRKKIKSLSEEKPSSQIQFSIKEEKYSSLDKDVLIQGDVIDIITCALQSGYLPVVNNAANSHRDGSAKYSKGSLEEALARNTPSMFEMLCHFKEKNVRHSARRYLRACLVMMQKILHAKNPDAYINSTKFLEDYLSQTGMESKNQKAEPIHFDLQNKLYEVNPEKGFFSYQLFRNSRLSTFSDFKKEIKDNTLDRNIIMIHSAAPDLRRVEGLADKLCATHPILRHPENYHTFRKMVKPGINLQCDQAIEAAKLGEKPYIIFVLPGCGAFGNPLHESVEIFLELIHKRKDELNKLNIPFCIVEKNPKTFEVLNNYLHPPQKVTWNWKVVLACFTSFLIVPLIYVALFYHERSWNNRYHEFNQEHNLFQLKNILKGKKEKQKEFKLLPS